MHECNCGHACWGVANRGDGESKEDRYASFLCYKVSHNFNRNSPSVYKMNCKSNPPQQKFAVVMNKPVKVNGEKFPIHKRFFRKEH